MAVFKCKMCGGPLEFQGKETVAVCEYCGTKQTLPRLDSDRRRNLYDRANHFRRSNEYDRAAGIYEQILNEDQEDAEAYWSLVLCRYGIEYVEDEETHRRIPTVNRTQFSSVLSDADYRSALRYADGEQKVIYEAEAKAIDEIQKGILEISGREKPFDVFLCYKETGSDGKRTPDSVLANDLYHQLAQEGFRVFFSRITLEDKLGTAYEPYIFAALNSARVMVALGTKPEYFQAAWVKNEWNRYLALAKRDPKKVLIPAYRDMDPYDLPEEFSHLQAQDMSKLGFMQDLIRGIRKILASGGAKTAERAVSREDGPGNAGAAPLLRRAFMFLEDGEWADADEYCEKVLDQEPENAGAYLGKLMAELKVRQEEMLKDLPEPFDQNRNYQKALRFADEELASALKGYVAHISDRNEQERKAAVYRKAAALIKKTETLEAYREAAELFSEIPGYRDADILRLECEEKIKDLVYGSAKSKLRGTLVSTFEEALEQFESIPGWKDADEQAVLCGIKIEELKKEEEERKRRKEEAERAEAKKKKKFLILAAVLACACVAAIVAVSKIVTANRYQKAVSLMEAGEYDEAIELFGGLGDYKDSPEKLEEIDRIKERMAKAALADRYLNAVSLLEEEHYEEAYNEFEALDDYRDSSKKMAKAQLGIRYGDMAALVEAGEYEKADQIYEDVVQKDYEDCKELLEKMGQLNQVNQYHLAEAFLAGGYYKEASAAFVESGYYGDSHEKMLQIFQSVSEGDVVCLGSYEQDNNERNGPESIEWKVLEKEENRILVLSRYVLDERQYDSKYARFILSGDQEDLDYDNPIATWENCSLRQWLNQWFMEQAFEESEQAYIWEAAIGEETHLDTEETNKSSVTDKIFLLSPAEVTTCFSSRNDRKGMGSRAVSGKEDRYLYAVGWWTRNASKSGKTALMIDYWGEIKKRSVEERAGVRPAMWISLKPENEP